jgi:hypothetical protein
MDILKILLVDSRFWAAMLLLINAILYFFVPTFPATIWAAFDGVAAVIIGFLASNGAVKTNRANIAAKAAKE